MVDLVVSEGQTPLEEFENMMCLALYMHLICT